MIYRVLSLYYLPLFPPLAAVSLPEWLLKSLLFSLRLRFCVHSRKRKLAVFFPPFHHALITCCNVARAGYIAYCITIGIHLILVNATWPRINQWQSLFSWVKVQEYNNVGCYMLRPFAHPVACCCAQFETGQTFSYVQTDATTPNIVFFFFLYVNNFHFVLQ